MDRDDHDDRSDEKRPRLQSLAQAARSTQLKQVRGTLLAIGILTLIVHGAMLFTVPDQVRKAAQENQAQQAKQGMVVNPADAAMTETIMHVVGYMIGSIPIAMGLLFILFGALVQYFPVPITIASLVLYSLVTLVCFITDLSGGGVGSVFWVVLRIMFVIALVKAVGTAFAYQKERRRDLALAESDLEDDDRYD
jgi:uncharacterized protein YjeT (DUF2065 family)